jgi:hypothetical protein
LVIKQQLQVFHRTVGLAHVQRQPLFLQKRGITLGITVISAFWATGGDDQSARRWGLDEQQIRTSKSCQR